MSWLGSGLSQITGQISNFTKEVLTEGTEEVDDHVTELRLAKTRVAELENQNHAQKNEMERLRAINSELLDKLQSSELQISAISGEYRQKLQQSQEEVKNLKQQHNELLELQQKMAVSSAASSTVSYTSPASAASHHTPGLGGADEHDFHDVISGQREIYQLRLEVQRLRTELTHWRTLAEQSRSSARQNGADGNEDPDLLHQRILELEQQLRDEVDSHQRELAALQDVHNQKLYTVKQQLKQQLQQQQQQQQDEETNGTSSQEMTRLNVLVKELQEANEKLTEEKETLATQIEDRLQGSPDRDQPENDHNKTDPNLARTLREGRLPSSTPMDSGSYSRRVISRDESYSESLVLDLSELSMQNESLTEQVERLQKQVKDYEEEMQRFDDIKVDWDAEKEALENVLLQLRQKLHTKEEAKKAEETKKETEVPQKSPKDEKSGEDAELEKSKVESLETDLTMQTAKLMEALERMEQQDAELEKLQQLLQEMQESQLNNTEDTSLQADLNLKGEQLQEALEKAKNSDGELQKLKVELEQKETVLEEISIDKEALEASLEELDAQHQEALQQVLTSRETLVASNEELKQQVAALKENSALHEEKAELSAISDEAIDKEIASLRERLEKEQTQQHEMKEKLNKAAHSLNDLHMDKQELEKSNSSLSHKVSELSAKIKDITAEKAELIKSVENLESSLNQTREELERSASEAPVDDIEFKVQESQERCDKLQETIDQLESQIKNLGQERSQLTEELQNNSFSLSQSEGSNKDLTLRVSQLSTQVEALNSEKVSLLQDVDQIEQKMQDQRHHYESFIQQLKQSREMDESGLQHQVEHLAKDCYDKDHKISDLESAISGLKTELQEQKEMVQAALDGQCGVKELLSDKESKISSLRSENQSLNELLEENERNIKTLEAEVERLKDIETHHKHGVEEAQKLQDEIETLRKQLKHQVSQEEIEAKDSRMLGVMTDLESEISSLKNALEEQKSVISERDTEVLKLKDNITLGDSKIIDLNRKSQEHSVDMQKLSDELESAKASVNQKDQEVTELKQKFQDVGTKKSENLTNNNENDNNNTEGVYIENGDIDGQRNGADYEVLQEELEEVRKIAAQKDCVITELRVNNSALLKMLEDKSLQLHGDKSLVEIHKLENEVRSLRKEREQIMSILNEKSRECSNLKSEVHKLMNVISAEKNAISKLQQDNNELLKKREDPNSDMTKETVRRLSQIIRDKDLEIESLTMKTQTLLHVLQDNSQEGTQLSTLVQEKENLMKQVVLFQQDREQIIQALNQKHQESVAFHGEVQRLSALQNNSTQELDGLMQQYANLKKQYEDKQQALLKVQNDLLNYKQKYSEIENRIKQSEGKAKEVEVARQATPPSEELRQSPPPVLVSPPVGNEQEQLGSMIRELRKTLSQREDQCKEKDSLIVQNGIKLKDKEDLIHKKDAIIAEKAKVISDMNVKLREVKGSVREKEIEVGAQKKKVDNLTFQLQGLQVEVHDLQAQNSQLSDERSNFQSQIVQMKEANNRLNVTVGERDLEVGALKEKIATLTQLVAAGSTTNEEKGAVDQRMAETEAMQKQAQIFQQERDQAMTSLRAKQMDLQQLQHQYSKLTEREKKLEREVERLRSHLLQIEDGYTQEALAAEEREKDLRNRLAHAEERASSQSYAVQNANAMASQQLESLEKQLYEVTSQRDSALQQLAITQEQANQYATNLANLQMVLEQFTHEREQQLTVEVERYQQQLSSCRFERDQLRHQCRQLQVELDETKEALEAAHRLSEQLDRKEATISALREEVQMREQELLKAEEELNSVKTTNEGKVDKALIKNLFLGYFHLPSGKRSEGIRLIGKVLSFTEEEMKQAGLDGASGWLMGMTGMLRKGLQVAPRSPGGSPGAHQHDKSFSELFVKFLEQESTPTIAARLPMDQMIQEQQLKQQQKHHQPFNPFAAIPASASSVPTPTAGGLVSLTGDPRESHLLMAPLTPTLPTFNPIIPSVTPSSGRGSAASSGRSTPASSAILRDVLQQS